MKKLVLATILLVVLMTMSVGAEVIYNSIDYPLPGSYPSLGYEATSTSEMGDHIEFTGVERELDSVQVTMTNWACENDYVWDGDSWVPDRDGYVGEACETTPGSGFEHPITLNIYEVDNSGPNPAVGPLIVSKTETFFIEYRPSWDSTNCAESGQTPADDIPFGGLWYDPVLEACVHGHNQIIEFDFTQDNVILPDEVIYTISYNTANHGEEPIGEPGPYSSLNYGLSQGNTIGIDVEPDTVFLDSTWSGAYCDGGADGTGTLRRDAGCWEGYVPTATFNVISIEPPTGSVGVPVGVTPTGTCPEIIQEACDEGYEQEGSVCYKINTASNDLGVELGPEGPEAGRSYAFEGESIVFEIFVEDLDGIVENCVKAGVTLEQEEEVIQAGCVLADTEDKDSNGINEWGKFICTYTVEPSHAGAYGKYWISVMAADGTCQLEGGCEDHAAGLISLWLNPEVSLTIDSQDQWGFMYDEGGDTIPAYAGSTVYSPYFTLENTANPATGLYLYLQMYGTDMWDLDELGSPALCPDSNVLDIRNVDYKATHGNIQQPWTMVSKSATDIFLSNPFGNLVGVGDDLTMRLRLNIPTPCVGTFDDGGEIIFVGQVI